MESVREELFLVLHDKLLFYGVVLHIREEYLVIRVSQFLHEEVLGYGYGNNSVSRTHNSIRRAFSTYLFPSRDY